MGKSDRLTPDQEAAIHDATGMLIEMAKPRASERRTDPLLATVTDAQHANVVLIDGERGTGKTVALLHIIENLRRFSRRKLDQPVGYLSDISAELIAKAEATTWIVPLPIIDLEAQHDAMNALMFAATRLWKFVEGAAKERSPFLGMSDRLNKDDLESAWADVRDAIALGSGYVVARKGELTADEWALLLEDTEHTRAMRTMWSKFVDHLVSAMSIGPTESKVEPLFVITTDDVDMNPEKAVEWLSAIRLLEHPRIAHMLVGDSSLLRALLEISLRARLRSKLRAQDLTEKAEFFESDRGLAPKLATQQLEKVIPAVQRCRVRKLPPGERLAMLEQAMAMQLQDAKEDAQSKKGGLSRGQDALDSALTALLESLPESRSQYKDVETLRSIRVQLDKHTHVHAALPGAIRESYALAERLYLEKERGNGVFLFAKQLWDNALTRWAVSPELVADLSERLRIEPGGSSASAAHRENATPNSATTDGARMVLDTIGVEVRVLYRDLERFRIPHVRRTRSSEAKYEAHVMEAWLRKPLVFEAVMLDTSGRRAVAPPDVTAALVLATDVIADSQAGALVGSSLAPTSFSHGFVSVVHDFGVTSEHAEISNTSHSTSHNSEASLGVSRLLQSSVALSWPLPNWDGFYDFHLAAELWERVVAGLKSSLKNTMDANALVLPFIGVGLTIAQERDRDFQSRERTLVEAGLAFADMLRATEHGATIAGSTKASIGRFVGEFREAQSRLSRLAECQRDRDNRAWVQDLLPLLCEQEMGLSTTARTTLQDLLALTNASLGARQSALREARYVLGKSEEIVGATSEREFGAWLERMSALY